MDEEIGTEILDGATTGPYERPIQRLLVLSDRLVLAGVLLAAAFVFFIALEVVGGFRSVDRAPLLYLFSALTGGNFTLITIIVSINQLVVSRQLSTPGELRTQIAETNEYRESVIETLPANDVAPVTPTEFLHLLLRATRESLARLEHESDVLEDGEVSTDGGDTEMDVDADAVDASELVAGLVDDLTDHIDYVDELLRQSDSGIFSALSATLTTNYSQHIFRARELQNQHADELTGTQDEALDQLVVLLQQIDVARQYLKTLYMQDELSQLSQRLLIVGIPAVFVSIVMLKLFAASQGMLFSTGTLTVLTDLAVTVALAPLAVVFSFVLRIAAVARRTVAITPFTTASQEL
ncbi:hypothetical protein [Haloarcula onubensis]|uniref:Uncharacterized protein n=1 Tax=Haloarcula onubensis TaxID=2950539 RepID=A0ABU2FNI9_9EURY|nr:hypothetical protein [Halomicroarcula sp. S3CR25-11]MDS0282325.1 hypothetical protein [Halomicroarcula sp. S3CR25-11]